MLERFDRPAQISSPLHRQATNAKVKRLAPCGGETSAISPSEYGSIGGLHQERMGRGLDSYQRKQPLALAGASARCRIDLGETFFVGWTDRARPAL